MSRYKGVVDYRGSNYAGWQCQPRAKTVQGEIEKALSTFYRTDVKIVGCGRTDAGVHAQNYVFHFEISEDFFNQDLKGINAILPWDISIKDIAATKQDFHARYNCTGRIYNYHIHQYKNPFKQDISFEYFLWGQVDVDKMNEALSILLGNHSFYTFCKSNSGVDHYMCTLEKAVWIPTELGGVLEIKSNRFLRGMVRLIVGMSLQVGLGKLSIEKMKSAFHNQKRLSKPWSVPPEGLHLIQLEYPTISSSG